MGCRLLQDMLDQPLQFLIGLGADHQIFAGQKSPRHAKGGAAFICVAASLYLRLRSTSVGFVFRQSFCSAICASTSTLPIFFTSTN